MSANNLLLGLGDSKDKNYTYIVKGTGTDTRELVKVVNATGIATTIYTYPANYVCLYTLQDDDYLTYTLMNPHKIEAKFHLNVLDLYEIDFTHPIFLAQFGQIYYIEEIKFNSEESEVTLVELKNTDYR